MLDYTGTHTRTCQGPQGLSGWQCAHGSFMPPWIRQGPSDPRSTARRAGPTSIGFSNDPGIPSDHLLSSLAAPGSAEPSAALSPERGLSPAVGPITIHDEPRFLCLSFRRLATCPTAQAPSAVGQQLCSQQAARLLHVCMRAHAHACLHMVYHVPHRARNLWSQQPTTASGVALPLSLHP